ncbi:MAG: hypothetical protein ACRCXT_07285, partial [Paraclostridium sp.]
SDNNIDYIDKIKNERNCHNRSDALRLIIDEHQNSDNKIDVYSLISENISNALRPQLNAIKYSLNRNNEDIQVQTELINGIYINNDFSSLLIDSLETPHKATEKARDLVKERILKQSYQKHNRVD